MPPRKFQSFTTFLFCGGLLLSSVARADLPPTGADPPARSRHAATWDVFGEGRLTGVFLRDFGLDSTGFTADRNGWAESRLRLGGRLLLMPFLEVTLEIEALNGTVAGDFTTVGQARGQDTFQVRRDHEFGGGAILPRQAYLSLDTPVGRVLLGQQTFDWGLGLLANSGAGDPDFGDTYQGNLVERLAFVVRPLAKSTTASEVLRSATLFVAADIVFRDDNASLLLGDFAWAIPFGIRLSGPRFEVGALGVMRRQTDREDAKQVRTTEANVWVADAFAKVNLTTSGSAHSLRVETEAALIAGDTNRPNLDETIASGANILSFGGALRLRYDNPPQRLTAKVEVGYASGDNDAHDDIARQFAFHSDYNVGLLLFDQVLPMLSARSVDRIVDPALTATSPASTRFLVNQGQIANAVYLNPTIRLRPVPSLDVRFGYLLAATDADFVDPYSSAKNGGFNTTYGGKSPGDKLLGHELNVGLRYGFPLGAGVTLKAGFEAGVFFPGQAMDGLPDTRPITMGRLLSNVSF